MKKIIHLFISFFILVFFSFSLQLVYAWTEPTLTAPNGNLGAPINTGSSTQTKTGALYVNGGIVTPSIWDTDNTGYYINPFGSSQVSSIYANGGFFAQGSAGLSFFDHNGGWNMIDNTWIRATGVGNIYAPGELQATNIRANSTLCLGTDCRTAWPAGEAPNTMHYDTGYYDANGNLMSTYQSNGNIFMSWTNDWLSNVLNNKLQLNTWQYSHFFASDGRELATMFVDSNDYRFYVDPNNVSTLNTVFITGNAYIHNIIDYDNNSYNLDINGYSNLYSVTASSFYYSSDANLKKNIAPLNNSLEKISQLQGVNFQWKDPEKDQKINIGLIAQDVEKIYPELVNTDKKTGLKSVEYGNLVAPLIEAIKEQQKEIDSLNQKIDNLTR